MNKEKAKPKSASRPSTARGMDSVIASDSRGVVDTSVGKVRGYTRYGIYTFKGIPYAATTTGDNRFMPPQKVAPWSGVRSSVQYGYVCPQVPRADWADDENAFMFSWDDGVPNEDCLRVNIWTPGVNDTQKRPVMVWLHGGAYMAGSGQELRSYDGENLSRRGDVVVVTLNHRLGPLGYLNLAEMGGEKFAESGNVGMLDLVAALEWVRDNIANFGGDPSNVLIFGQSGGGCKVSALMAMPAAEGLFHRAVVASGSFMMTETPQNSARLAAAVLAELGLSAGQLDQLQTVSAQRLIRASSSALAKLAPAAQLGMGPLRLPKFLFAPVVDGRVLPENPFHASAPAISAKVPMIIGTCLNEFTTATGHPEYESMTEAQVRKRLSKFYDDETGKIIEVFRRAYPGAKPFDLLSLISTAPIRQSAVTQAERKAAQGAAPVYLYWFTWQTPILDGRPRAFHCAEIAFVFDNTDRCENMTGGGAAARTLAGKVSDAWINFARSGNPNHEGLPHWPPYTADNGAVMIFDNKPEVKFDPDRAERSGATSPTLGD